jgi:hypothetical protein
MHEIICPHCSKAFKIDEAGYADILKQVRDGDFDKQLHERLELAEREKRDAIALAEAKFANELQAVCHAFMGVPDQRCRTRRCRGSAKFEKCLSCSPITTKHDFIARCKRMRTWLRP